MSAPTTFSYATPDDLAAWLPDTTQPESTTRLLRSASFMVSRACNRDPYTDTGSALALRDATCAQVASWLLLGVDPAKRGTDYVGAVRSSSMLGDQVTRDTSAVSGAMAEAVDSLCDESCAILLQAGLLFVAGPLFDPNPVLPSWGTGPTGCPPFVDPLTGEYGWPGPWPTL